MMKVNKLAKELREKGMAGTSEEATKLAESYLNKEIVPEAEKKSPDNDRYDILLERLQRKLNQERKEMQDKVQSLANDIGFIKEELKKLKQAKPQEPRQEKLQPKTEDRNQRTGDLKPGDVKVEEYFYYGDKKK